MKSKYLSNLYPCLCLLSVFQSCESDVPFKGGESAPKMVLNSIINANEEKQALQLSESLFLFGDREPRPVDETTLQLKVNGMATPLTFVDTKEQLRYYNFNAALSPGDKVEIFGSSPDHNNIYGADYVPEPVEITGLQTEWFIGATDNNSYLRTLITIKDKPGEKNFYRIVIRGKSHYEEEGKYGDTADWVQYNVYVEQEPLFNHIPNTPWDETPTQYHIFPDELIDGKEYTLNVYVREEKEDSWDLHTHTSLKVEIHSLSENLYRYLRSVELAGSGDNFTEPVKIFSNIDGGYGVLGIYSVSSEIVLVKNDLLSTNIQMKIGSHILQR